jgi:hypothetical protein
METLIARTPTSPILARIKALPLSSDSIDASLSMSRSISSAILIKYLPLSEPEQFGPHVLLNALWAASRASSTSAGRPSGMDVMSWPMAGLTILQRVSDDQYSHELPVVR